MVQPVRVAHQDHGDLGAGGVAGWGQGGGGGAGDEAFVDRPIQRRLGPGSDLGAVGELAVVDAGEHQLAAALPAAGAEEDGHGLLPGHGPVGVEGVGRLAVDVALLRRPSDLRRKPGVGCHVLERRRLGRRRGAGEPPEHGHEFRPGHVAVGAESPVLIARHQVLLRRLPDVLRRPEAGWHIAELLRAALVRGDGLRVCGGGGGDRAGGPAGVRVSAGICVASRLGRRGRVRRLRGGAGQLLGDGVGQVSAVCRRELVLRQAKAGVPRLLDLEGEGPDDAVTPDRLRRSRSDHRADWPAGGVGIRSREHALEDRPRGHVRTSDHRVVIRQLELHRVQPRAARDRHRDLERLAHRR